MPGEFRLLAYLAATAAVLAGLWGLLHFIDNTWATSAGFEKGKAETVAEYAKRDNEQLKKVVAERDRLQKEKEALEARMTGLVAEADQKYQEGLSDGQRELNSAVARVHAGYRLRDPGAKRTGGGAGLPAADPATGTGGGDGGQGADLSAASTEFLLRLASEADAVTKQLAACQAVIKADRMK